jgi:hypothetical protein
MVPQLIGHQRRNQPGLPAGYQWHLPGSGNCEWMLYPVPSNGQVTFDFYMPDGSAKYQASLFNSLGQLVYQEDGTGQPGMNRILYNWDRLAAGVYTYQLQVGTVIYKKRLILQ